jgi:hypothetical protein
MLLFLGFPWPDYLFFGYEVVVYMKRRRPTGKGGRFYARLLDDEGWLARFFGLKTGGFRCRRSGATSSTRHKSWIYGDP